MLCPNCQAEVREGAAFCGSCGATLEQARPQAEPAAAEVTEPLPQPTAQMPQAQAEPAYDAAAYAQQQAAYEQQKAAYEQQQYAQQQAAYSQTYVPPVPPRKSKTGLIVAIVVVLVLLLAGCGVGGFFAFKALKSGAEKITTPDATTTDTDTSDTDTSDTDIGDTLSGYATADEAVAAQLSDAGVGDWVYQLYDEGYGYATYWAGPPNSEFVDEIYLEQNSDGSWSVVNVYSLDGWEDPSGGDSTVDEAISVVGEFLYAVKQDRPDDAHALTVEPFSLDPASAQYSNGQFSQFEVLGASEQPDGTVWVETSETWYGTTEWWRYLVVPTEAGYRISVLEPY
ncbi:MAG: zinc ribbon domain-containing protein [Coriobacteriia bacterium]|nr:zinc ribbon domain-containing protein [Coriobacteriia bacterium]